VLHVSRGLVDNRSGAHLKKGHHHHLSLSLSCDDQLKATTSIQLTKKKKKWKWKRKLVARRPCPVGSTPGATTSSFFFLRHLWQGAAGAGAINLTLSKATQERLLGSFLSSSPSPGGCVWNERGKEKRVRKNQPVQQKKWKMVQSFFSSQNFQRGTKKIKSHFHLVWEEINNQFMCVCVCASPPFFSFHAASVVFW
jgi:hypothetical protein